MRITDSRYDRDRLRLTVAHRLIGLEARTHTIRQATQLSDDRIRRLYRDYFPTRGDERVVRHRGKSPRQMSYYRRSLEHEQQAATLGSLTRACGLVEPAVVEFRPSLERVARYCDVYDTFSGLWTIPLISFEHAWHLWQVFCRVDDEYQLSTCPQCGSLWLRDTLEILPDNCASCRRDTSPVSR